jgi:hypothetical protein
MHSERDKKYSLRTRISFVSWQEAMQVCDFLNLHCPAVRKGSIGLRKYAVFGCFFNPEATDGKEFKCTP